MVVSTRKTRPIPRNARGRAPRAGFTLLQILIVLSLVTLMAVVGLGVLGGYRGSVGTAKRASCDVNLKEIVLALDTFRQENGKSPGTLAELMSRGYIGPNSMRCPADPALPVQSANPAYISYEDLYLIREPGDSGELPVVVCPLHNGESQFGNQGYKGGYSTQYASVPAKMGAADYSGTVTITRPGTGVLPLPKSGEPALLLRGGDRIRTGAGTALIRFEDKSEASVASNSEITVLESYREGRSTGPLYNLVRQFGGKVSYYVNPGSFFDVATPTATAGALGTRFTIQILAPTSLLARQPDTLLTVTEHTVAFTSATRTIEVVPVDSGVRMTEIKRKVRQSREKGWNRNWKNKKDKR